MAAVGAVEQLVLIDHIRIIEVLSSGKSPVELVVAYTAHLGLRKGHVAVVDDVAEPCSGHHHAGIVVGRIRLKFYLRQSVMEMQLHTAHLVVV